MANLKIFHYKQKLKNKIKHYSSFNNAVLHLSNGKNQILSIILYEYFKNGQLDSSISWS